MIKHVFVLDSSEIPPIGCPYVRRKIRVSWCSFRRSKAPGLCPRCVLTLRDSSGSQEFHYRMPLEEVGAVAVLESSTTVPSQAG